MKKLMVSLALILGSLSIYAITNNASQNVRIQKNIQTEYTEVSLDTVPLVVKKALDKAYPGTKIEKAYINDKKEYKLEISLGDQKATVYTDVNGSWLK